MTNEELLATQFRKKPVVIEAIKWTGDNWDEVERWCPYGLTCQRDIGSKKYVIIVDTFEGRMRCEVGDWIIKGIKGEFYPVKDDIFQATYESIDEKLQEPKMTREGLTNLFTELIDKNFPKGECKERGKALVLIAEAIIALEGKVANPSQ